MYLLVVSHRDKRRSSLDPPLQIHAVRVAVGSSLAGQRWRIWQCCSVVGNEKEIADTDSSLWLETVDQILTL